MLRRHHTWLHQLFICFKGIITIAKKIYLYDGCKWLSMDRFDGMNMLVYRPSLGAVEPPTVWVVTQQSCPYNHQFTVMVRSLSGDIPYCMYPFIYLIYHSYFIFISLCLHICLLLFGYDLTLSCSQYTLLYLIITGTPLLY